MIPKIFLNHIKGVLIKYNPRKVIYYLENSSVSYFYFILFFFFSINLRIFLELFVDRDYMYKNIFPITYFSYCSSFITEILVLIVLFRLITKTRIDKISKWILASSFMINLPPILDLFFSFGKGYDYANFFPGDHHQIFLRFITFFGDSITYGISPGLRIETVLELIGSFIYFSLKLKNRLKSLAGVLLVYITRFSFAAFPYYLKGIFGIFGVSYTTKGVGIDYIFIKTNLFLVFILGIIIIYLYNKYNFGVHLRYIKIKTILFSESIFIIGISLGLKSFPFQITSINIMNVILSQLCLFISFVFVIFLDKFKSKFEKRDKFFLLLFFTLSVIYSFSVNYIFAIMNVTFIGIYYIYSNTITPIRFANIPFISNIFLSVNFIILLLMGYTMVTGELVSLPNRIVLLFIVYAIIPIYLFKLRFFYMDNGFIDKRS